jgi:hypothetical protein
MEEDAGEVRVTHHWRELQPGGAEALARAREAAAARRGVKRRRRPDEHDVREDDPDVW